MSVPEVISTLNRMSDAGVIERYAISDAVGATFYLEPVATIDVDIFVTFRPDPGRLIVSPQPIFDYLKSNGCVMDGEYVVIAGWPVQFLPADGPLVGEALRIRSRKMWMEFPPAFSPPNIWRPSPFKRDEPKTKHGCFSSSRQARSTWRVSRILLSNTVSPTAGIVLKASF